MNWQVLIPQNIRKRLRRFPQKDQERILDALREFEYDPWFGDIEKIAGEEHMWRRRVGNYRIFYCAYVSIKLVEV